ncbi:MAG: DUF4340 domain-containing protein, partial [Candidatus Eremiobacteraeota bacterium]|nr:DUF4340 domain-containing protein [Candidatus Eremiobacteraeota bacterium]
AAQRDGYPASVQEINNFLRKIEELKVTQGLEAGPSFAPRFGMDEKATTPEDHGLDITFKDAAGHEVTRIALGKNIEPSASLNQMAGGMSIGRYVRNFADDSGFYAVSEMFTNIGTGVAQWLDQDFFKVEKIATIQISKAGSDEAAWKVHRDSDTAEFVLDGAKPDEVLDTGVSNQLKNLLMAGRFSDVVPAAELADRWDDAAQQVLTITTFDGFTYTITLSPDKKAAPATSEANPGAPPASDMLLKVAVSADLAKERTKGTDEKPEDAKKLDDEFAEHLKALNEKLGKEKALEGHTYTVARYLVEPVLKDRTAILTTATPAPPAAAAPGATVQRLPGGVVATPGQGTPQPPRPRVAPGKASKSVEVYTPPVAIPTQPTEDKEKAVRRGGP